MYFFISLNGRVQLHVFVDLHPNAHFSEKRILLQILKKIKKFLRKKKKNSRKKIILI